MSGGGRIGAVGEAVGLVAVVLSLVYVGLQIKQNTIAIQTATSQAIYDYHRELQSIGMENADFEDILVRSERAPETLSPVDSSRLMRRVNLRVNLYESVYTNVLAGSMEADMAGGWLRGLAEEFCEPFTREFWSNYGYEYHPAFILAVDSVQAESCPNG